MPAKDLGKGYEYFKCRRKFLLSTPMRCIFGTLQDFPLFRGMRCGEKGRVNSRRGVEFTRPLSPPFVRRHVDFLARQR